MQHFLRAFAGAVASLSIAAGALAAEPAERRVGLEQQTGVAVTIYNQDLALVRDRRRTEIETGINRLAFIDVSAVIRPETALLRGPDGRLAVLEQNFNFDLLTPEKLLEKSVGRQVRVITMNPLSGAQRVEEATVLSVAGGVVLRIGDRIETAPTGRIVFADVPPDLRARPTLVLDVDSTAAGPSDLELTYLTGGLSWSADYVAKLAADEKSLSLNGLVTLTNTSGTTYRNAKLQLVAGDVNQVQPMMTKVAMMDMAVAEAAPAPMREEALFDYHLYTLTRPTTIAENQTKQVAMMSASGIPVTKEYRFVDISNAYDFQMAEPRRVNAAVRIAFDNTEKDNLGQPLPRGIVRVYKDDSEGSALFVGEDSIEHTPKGEPVRLTLGQAFDVTALSKQVDFERLSDRIIEVGFEVEAKNAKKEPVTIKIVEHVPGQWRMLEESHEHRKEGAFTVSWDLTVPAEGKTVLKYRLRIEY